MFIERSTTQHAMTTQHMLKKTLTSVSLAVTIAATSLVLPLTAQAADYIVATVDETPILRSELDTAVANAIQVLRKSNSPIPASATLQAQVLDRLITRTTQLNLINRLGRRINNEAINESLRSIAAKRGVGSLSEFQIMLEQKQPGSYAALRKQIREEMTIQQLRQQELNRRVKISKQDIDYFLLSPESEELHKTEYRTNHVRISVPENSSTAAQRNEALKIAAEVKRAFDAGAGVKDIVLQLRQQSDLPIQGGDMGFHAQQSLPFYLREQIKGLKIGQTTTPVAHTDGVHVVNLIDKKDAGEQIVHQWKVSHILVKPNEIMSIGQAKQSIDDIYDKLRQNQDFATLATTYSDDPGSARKGGSLDWVTSGQMVPQFDAMMKNTPVGQYSQPFQSQFGWHILKVEDERDKNMSEKFKRNVARQTLFKRMSSQAVEDWMQELRTNSHIRILDPRFKS